MVCSMRRPVAAIGDLRGTAPLLFLLLCASAVSVAAQPQYVERVDVARVVVDARVVDNKGRALLGLEPADFVMRIDGEPVRVESALWAGGAAPLAELDSPSAPTGLLEAGARGRLIVFVVQKSMHGHRLPGLLSLLQESGKLLDQLTPEDRIAVLSFDSHLKVWVDFTGDVDRVRTVLADELLFKQPAEIVPGRRLSIVARLSQDLGRQTYSFEDALRLLGNALEPLPGAKSIVLIGHGFGQVVSALNRFGTRLDRGYAEARAALQDARAAVFSLDVTDADYHSLAHGLQSASTETGGFYVRAQRSAPRAVERVTNALVGHYVLFAESPGSARGRHDIEVELATKKGRVYARQEYVD